MNSHSCAEALVFGFLFAVCGFLFAVCGFLFVVCGFLFAVGVFLALEWKSTSPDKADQFPYCYVFPGKGIAGGSGMQEPQEFQHLRVCYKNPIHFSGAGGGGSIGKQQESKP